MAQMKIPAPPTLHSTSYGNLRGIDFSVDPSLVAKNRSPYCPNIISNEGGNPTKRTGWRILHKLENPINGLFFVEMDNIPLFIAHGGTKLYTWSKSEGDFTQIYDGINNSKSTSFFMREDDKDKLFILTGKEFLAVMLKEDDEDGRKICEVSEVCENAFIPTILISRLPSGGGEPYEAVNLLQPKRTESFLGNIEDKVYQLSATDIDSTTVLVKKNNADGEYDELVENTHFTVNRKTGKVTFNAAHPPVVTGQDNIHITYSKTVDGYKERITQCTIAKLFGVGGDNRVFVSGNSEYKAHDWYSEIFKPSYFPDLGYAVIGGSDTAVMGYQKIGEYLSIIKEDNHQDTTLFLRSGTLNSQNKAVFSVRSGIAGTGAVSKYCFCNMEDEPLFLSRQGIYAIVSTALGYERSVRNRSYFLDKKLLAEKDLQNAVACEFNKYYILAINNKCYILDGRHKAGANNSSGEYVYESYYWLNVPAVCWLSVQGDLYFGTADGEICKFNFDIEDMTKYSDGGELINNRVENGKAIECQWATPNDNDNATHFFKTMQKKGCLATLSPFTRSSGEVLYVVDGNPERFIRMQTMDIFDFSDIDFERITFSSNTSPQEIFFKKKVKKYIRLMIIIRNNAINEGFGLHEIVKTFSVGNFSKYRGGK